MAGMQLPAHLQAKILGMLDDKVFSAATGISIGAAGGSAGSWQPYREVTGARFSPSAAIHALKNKGIAVFDSLLGAEACKRARDEVERMHGDGQLRAAGMGRGDSAWTDQRARGDEILWMAGDPLTTRREEGVGEGQGGLGGEGGAGLGEVVERMHGVAREVWGVLCPGGGLDKSKYQLARYPGGGARYVKHTDVSERCPTRRVTAIYYLNSEWTEKDGGELRVYPDGGGGGVDVAPLGDRLVLFLSDLEHEVLPSHAVRVALSGWLYSETEARPLLAEWPRRCDTDTVFVSVPAYRDTETQHTIRDLFASADRPDLLSVGLVSQVDPLRDEGGVFLDAGTQLHGHRIREVRMHFFQARGPCYARYLAQQLHCGERYYMQIDAHMRFAKGWDTFLISELKACPSHHPVLTSYPPGYARGGGVGGVPVSPLPTVMVATHFGEEGMLRTAGREMRGEPQGPTPSLFWAAGFHFSESSVIQRVPYDPDLKFLFFGEEQSMLARLFTHGYDTFAPSKAVVLHHWQRGYRPSFFKDVPDTHGLRMVSLSKVCSLLSCDSRTPTPVHRTAVEEAPAMEDEGAEDVASDVVLHINTCALLQGLRVGASGSEEGGQGGGGYGLGAARSAEEWQEHCGVDFGRQVLSERAKRGGVAEGLLVPGSIKS